MIRVLLFLYIFSMTSPALATWGLPNTPMTGLGDPGSFYLNKSGITLHLFNNDYIGLTDKLNTASGSLYLYYQPTNKNHGWEVSAHRRLYTPIIRRKFGEEPLDPPQGVYADQLEARLGYSYIDGWLKYEISGSFEYYAGLGGDNLQKFIHKVIGAKDETHKYGPKFSDNIYSGTFGIGAVSQYALFMVYVSDGPTMTDATARLNLKFGTEYQFGIQGEVSQQFHSKFYDRWENYRYGYGLSYKRAWYQFTANYISPYLKYDKFGQFYISPIVISYEF